MRFNKYLCTALFLLFTNIIVGQDSVILKTLIDVELVSRHNPKIGDPNMDCINCAVGKIRDNPINHFSIYGLPTMTLDLNGKYKSKVGLLMEQRAFSFGNYTRENLVVIPYLNFKVIDTFDIAGLKLKHSFNAGDLWNEDAQDILRLYNLDYQGVFTKLGYGHFNLGLLVVADLSNSIGLNIGRFIDFRLNIIEMI